MWAWNYMWKILILLISLWIDFVFLFRRYTQSFARTFFFCTHFFRLIPILRGPMIAECIFLFLIHARMASVDSLLWQWITFEMLDCEPTNSTHILQYMHCDAMQQHIQIHNTQFFPRIPECSRKRSSTQLAN